MAGNRIGPRARFLYTTDGGEARNYLTDDDHGSAMGAGYAPAGTPAITGIRPRYVIAVASDGVTKRRIVSPTPDNTAYLSGGNIILDGETFQITGRVGESQTFGRFGAPPAGGGPDGGAT